MVWAELEDERSCSGEIHLYLVDRQLRLRQSQKTTGQQRYTRWQSHVPVRTLCSVSSSLAECLVVRGLLMAVPYNQGVVPGYDGQHIHALQ